MYTCMYTEICYPAYSVKQVSTSRGSYDGNVGNWPASEPNSTY